MRLLSAAFALLLFVVPATAQAADCSKTSTGRVEISDLGTGTYQGEMGGLYPGGTNTPPVDYLARGISAGQAIQPINGKIGLISTGMSDAQQTFSQFKSLADADSHKRPEVQIYNGAQWGMDVDSWKGSKAWDGLARGLSKAGLSTSQVEAMWFYHAEEPDYSLNSGHVFPEDAQLLHTDFLAVLAQAESRLPNLKQVWLANTTYMAYSGMAGSEPLIGYDHGWAVKWTVADSVTQSYPGHAWLGWSFPQWTDGAAGRSDGLTWLCSDVQSDGIHLSSAGQQKMGQALLDRYLSDQTTGWFRR